MIYSLTWLPAVLRNAGLRVAEEESWASRGHGDVDKVLGVMCHHTVGPRSGNMPSFNTLISGRSDLPGPLSQLGLGRDGTYYVIAAGKCYHAGNGNWRGLTNGNGNFISIEAENTGGADDFPWPQEQMLAYHRGVAAILEHISQTVDFCVGHKEYALPVGRKPDPSFDMDAFRLSVAAIMNGAVPPLDPIPAFEPARSAGGALGRATLEREQIGNNPDLVKQVQQKFGVAVVDGVFGSKTEAAVRDFQRKHNLLADGIVGPETWAVFDSV